MVPFLSSEFFKRAGELLSRDQELAKVFEGTNATIILEIVDRKQAFLINVMDGCISTAEANVEDKADFRFSGLYDKWVKIAKGEENLQREVMKGGMKFSGSMPKMLLHLSKVSRMQKKILKIIGEMDLEY